MPLNSALKQTLAAAAALLAGAMVYWLDRPARLLHFLPEEIGATADGAFWFGPAGANLPSFLHIYAFVLLTTALLPLRRPLIGAICGFWFGLECLFEAGQHPSLSAWILPRLPDWLLGLPILDSTALYFANGTFDPLDILALALGALAAWLTVNSPWIRNHERLSET